MQTFDFLRSLFHICPHRNRRRCDTEGVHNCHLVCSVGHIDPPRSFVMLLDILVCIQYQKVLQSRKRTKSSIFSTLTMVVLSKDGHCMEVESTLMRNVSRYIHHVPFKLCNVEEKMK